MRSVNIIYGPPGSGKTTIGESLGGYCDYISVGKLSRQEFREKSDIGRRMLSCIESKVEYPEGLIDEFIRPHITGSSGSLLLDGFPKYGRELNVLNSIMLAENLNPGVFIEVRVDRSELVRRLNSRMICDSCDFQSNTESVCPKCNTDLLRRNDDKESEYLIRLDDFYLNRDIIRDGVRKLGFRIIEIMNNNDVDLRLNCDIVKNETGSMPE